MTPVLIANAASAARIRTITSHNTSTTRGRGASGGDIAQRLSVALQPSVLGVTLVGAGFAGFLFVAIGPDVAVRDEELEAQLKMRPAYFTEKRKNWRQRRMTLHAGEGVVHLGEEEDTMKWIDEQEKLGAAKIRERSDKQRTRRTGPKWSTGRPTPNNGP